MVQVPTYSSYFTPLVSIESEPACLFTPIEVDQLALQFEHALIMKFSAGRPNPYDIKLHIKHMKFTIQPTACSIYIIGQKVLCTEVPIWLKLPNLPLVYFNPTFLQQIRNSIGKFLHEDENTTYIQLEVHARICVEMDVAKPLPP